MRVTGLGAIDARGLLARRVGANPAPTTPVDPLGRLRWKDVFPDLPFPTFRRLDRLSKLACLAAEASGVGDRTEELRRDTAIVFATAWGCLDADVGFQESLGEGRDIKPALFPYTLPSTCLGEIAVRHRLQGPTLCLSASDAEPAVEQACLLAELGEARAVLLCVGDCLTEAAATLAGADAHGSFVALVLEPGDGPSLGELDSAGGIGALVDAMWEDGAP